jgi:hypothetical protein
MYSATTIGLVLLQRGDAGDAMAGLIAGLLGLAIAVVYIVAAWRVFQKAEQPGWGVLIPFYNLYLLMKIVGRPWWWMLLMLVPLLNIVIPIIVAVDLARSFGRSTLFGVILLWLLGAIGFLILGFGSARYVGPAAERQSW